MASENASVLSGFSDRVQDQLRHASQEVGRGRGHSRGPRRPDNRGHHPPVSMHVPQTQHSQDTVTTRQQQPSYWQQTPHTPFQPRDTDFPPLGSVPARPPPEMANAQANGLSRPPAHHNPGNFFANSRAGGNGRPHFPPRSRPHQAMQPSYRRTQPTTKQLFDPRALRGGHQQHDHRQKLRTQSDYLNDIARVVLLNILSPEEIARHNSFRVALEALLRKTVAEMVHGTPKLNLNLADVRLACYGSLASGFAVAGSDMDLLVMFPKDNEALVSLEFEARRAFEQALLKAGHGARLITNTRVPVMKVCERPSADLLGRLRQYREKWEEDEQTKAEPFLKVDDGRSDRLPVPDRQQQEAASKMFAELDIDAASVPLPSSPSHDYASLEYTEDTGMQCDINFSNHVAMYNTELLRCYSSHDPRVRHVGFVVKAWAKTRKINTPYYGTLSSYGYILMVLHYLMNVANPPVIPNLQHMAMDEDAWNMKTDVERFEGFDVRFESDPRKIDEYVTHQTVNQESVGSLLRGFFGYYSDYYGFNWMREVISIRTKGGIVSKESKGWTEAKWSGENNQVRQRYLFCIEDPFETEHNIARTVGHTGIITIRDEFRRARNIIERISTVPGGGWQWQVFDGVMTSESLLEAAQDRGDLLRKDQDFHRQKQRQMRADVEAKAKSANGEPTSATDEDPANKARASGTSSPRSNDVLPEAGHTSAKLTGDVKKQTSPPWSRGRVRKVKDDSDDEGEDAMTPEPNTSQEQPRQSGDASKEEDIEPTLLASPSPEALPSPSRDSEGNLVAWDLATEAGRWLAWRDRKMRSGKWSGSTCTRIAFLDHYCPYDPERPVEKHVYVPRRDRKPPWPSPAPELEQGPRIRSSSPAGPRTDATRHAQELSPAHIIPPAPSRGADAVAPPPNRAAHTNTSPRDQLAHVVVRWNRKTQGGRWLCWRDQMIRRRSTRTFNRYKALNEEFPYNPNLSEADLAAANQRLTEHYKDSCYGRGGGPSRRFPDVRTSSQVSASHEEHLRPEDPIPPEEAPQSKEQPQSEEQPRLEVILDVGPEEYSPQFIPEQRLRFFACQHPTSRKDSGVAGFGSEHLSHSETRADTETTRPNKRPEAASEKGERATASLESVRDASDTISTPPPPIALPFPFDSRQLRDLAIIQKGGNGCARQGEEYNVEIEHEWGGGGIMGWKSSTGFDTGRDLTNGHEDWEAGKGDEEGLLGELPGARY